MFAFMRVNANILEVESMMAEMNVGYGCNRRSVAPGPLPVRAAASPVPPHELPSMVTLRATRRVRGLASLQLQRSDPAALAEPDTALGDWCVKALPHGRQRLLLLVSARGLLACILPARDVRTLPYRLADEVARRLRRLEIPEAWIAAEVAAMDPVQAAHTLDRSVIGSLVDFAFHAGHVLAEEAPGAPADRPVLDAAEDILWGMPCRVSAPRRRYFFPEDLGPELLEERWG